MNQGFGRTLKSMEMKVYELADILGRIDQDIEVRLALHPHLGFENSIGKIEIAWVEGKKVLYISEGDQLDCLPIDAIDKLGWSNYKNGPWFK